MKKIHFETIDSTNNYAKCLIESSKDFHATLITADFQSNGKGRKGKSFSSEGGLYMSVVIYNRQENYPLTLCAAVAVRESLKELFDIDVKIKWVNDIFYNNKKVCGILSETKIENGQPKGFVCGIGINTKNTILPPQLSETATILPCSNENLAETIASKLLYMYENNISPTEKYKEGLMLNIPVSVINDGKEIFEGIAFDINENGNLLVNENGKIHVLNSGEISIKL